MTKVSRFDPNTQIVSLTRDLDASLQAEHYDPEIPVDGVTIGIATMTENAPHGGEMHADGDETLYLISGRARVVFLDTDDEDVEMTAGDGLIVPRGVWHRVDILEPCQIVYVTPGQNNQHRPLE